MKDFYVYIMANRSRTLYTGMTYALVPRVWEHKHMQVEGFTRRYLIDRLVYYEVAPDAASAIRREKQIKGWVRRKKIALIESVNPEWRDLSLEFLDIRPDVSARAGREQGRGRRDSSLQMAPAKATANAKPQSSDPSQRGAQNDGGSPVTTLPLSGIRVLDLTQVYAGPTCTRILSDLGADVIKLEGLKRMDITRNFVMPENNGKDDYWNRAGYFLLRNGGKKSLTLDFSDPEAVELVKRLVPHADVVAESFTPRVMAKFGLGYESLKAIKPEIVMISLSGYGQTGPWRDYTAYGMGLEPASGISSMTGYRDGPPLRTGISFTDPYSGVVGAGAVLAALHYRRRTGKGQYIDLSEHESAVPVAGFALMEYALNQRLDARMGNRSHWYAPQGCYRCAGDDNWLVITVRDDTEWEAFCHATGHPEWENGRFGDVLSRFARHDELDELISSWTREQGHIEAMHLLQKAGVIAAAVLNPKQVLLDPHLRERGFFDVIDQPDVGSRPVSKQLGAKFSAFEPDSARPAPKLGEHNREVLQGLLGLSDEDVARLQAQKVIGDTPEGAVPLDVMRMFVQWPTTTFLQMGTIAGLDQDYKEQLGIDGARNKEPGT